VIGQGVEAMLPHGAALGEPVFGVVKCASVEPAGSDAANLDSLDQSGLAEDLKVLVDAGEGHIEGCGQL